MRVSGIIVGYAPGRLQEVVAALSAMPSIDVHQTDEGSARLVATCDAETEAAHHAALREIQALSEVRYAHFTYLYVADDDQKEEEA